MYLKLYEDTQCSVQNMIVQFLVLHLISGKKSPVNERPIAVGIKVAPKPLLLQTPVNYIHVFKSKCPV
jgi:hypothetical protein